MVDEQNERGKIVKKYLLNEVSNKHFPIFENIFNFFFFQEADFRIWVEWAQGYADKRNMKWSAEKQQHLNDCGLGDEVQKVRI